jgi:hypothetical protein
VAVEVKSEWSIGDKVHVDKDTSITGLITAILWRSWLGWDDYPKATHYEVSWFVNGVPYKMEFEQWRITRVEN